MKRIIEHGYKCYMDTVCPSCGCKFSYDWEDVLKTDWNWTYKTDFTLHTSYPSYRITCPECGAEFEILNWHFTGYKDIPKITCIYTGDINED